MRNVFLNKKVLVTGHTGFKGAWLVAWLSQLNAKIMGISKDVPTKPSHFELLALSKKIIDLRIDIRSSNKLRKSVSKFKPDFVFHLAAQSLVKNSYENPLNTWETNLIGTINVLEAIKDLKNKCVGVIITSDKCYKNLEVKRGYTEKDILAGEDPYSASKSAAEIAIQSYVKSFFSNKKKYRIASVRAGNVIGGGDWNKWRIIPDCVKSIYKKKTAKIRNPNAVRPWLHVLEPLRGYLMLAEKLSKDSSLHGEAFNFGPKEQATYSVSDMLNEVKKNWKNFKWEKEKSKRNFFGESNLLVLDSSKVKKKLKWEQVLSFNETIKLTLEWYIKFQKNKYSKIDLITNGQIKEYQKYVIKITEQTGAKFNLIK